jgi:hypothetical protein
MGVTQQNQHDWEVVFDRGPNAADKDRTYRMRVPGGWIYRHWDPPRGENQSVSNSMVFVPDPKTTAAPAPSTP